METSEASKQDAWRTHRPVLSLRDCHTVTIEGRAARDMISTWLCLRAPEGVTVIEPVDPGDRETLVHGMATSELRALLDSLTRQYLSQGHQSPDDPCDVQIAEPAAQ